MMMMMIMLEGVVVSYGDENEYGNDNGSEIED